jgi:hypothetical protein
MNGWFAGEGCFSGAERYRAMRENRGGVVRERSGAPDPFLWSERHLRCVWADSRWRPADLMTLDRQRVAVEDPGRWNLEAGPDFLDAVLRVEPGARLIRGDVELHIRPHDWIQHGHSSDPRYQRVVAHVTYYPGAMEGGFLPKGAIEVSLSDALRRNPLFSFEAMDVSAYPYAESDPHPPCALTLAGWSPERRISLLESAGAERLRVKAARLRAEMAERHPRQVLYEEVMSGLGFKHNRQAFRSLATRVSLESLWHDVEGQGVVAAYALLSGVSGLLPAKTAPQWDEEARRFIRSVWDIWWKQKAGWDGQVMEKSEWRLANLRPPNHPLRRLMAAAELFCGERALLGEAGKWRGEGEGLCGKVMDYLGEIGGEGFWGRRTALGAAPLERPMALIGPGRAAALLSNAILPWMAAGEDGDWPGEEVLKALPAEDDNRFIRHMAHALFGHDHNPNLYRTGLRQQGLLQVFHDFCLNGSGGCKACRLPRILGEG